LDQDLSWGYVPRLQRLLGRSLAMNVDGYALVGWRGGLRQPQALGGQLIGPQPNLGRVILCQLCDIPGHLGFPDPGRPEYFLAVGRLAFTTPCNFLPVKGQAKLTDMPVKLPGLLPLQIATVLYSWFFKPAVFLGIRERPDNLRLPF
jgi:hypothetical protein